MIARRARFADIPSILALLRQCLDASRLSGAAEIDAEIGKAALMNVIDSQGDTARVGGVAVFVTGAEGDVTGLIAGTVQPMYFALTLPVGTDLMWYVDPERSKPGDGMALFDRLSDWFGTYDGHLYRQHSVNDMVMSPDILARMMRRKGYRPVGYLMEKE